MDFTGFKNFINKTLLLINKIFSLWLVDINVADLGDNNANINSIIDNLETIFNVFGGKTEEAE